MFLGKRRKNMAKHFYRNILLVALLTVMGGCQSVEYLSIDYLLPAEVSFPPSLKRVAVVNNMPDTPDRQMADDDTSKEKKGGNEAMHITRYYDGNATLATEVLAESIADVNYFDEVAICDSALRKMDITPRESTLTSDEVEQLTRELDVDFLIAVENVQMRAIRKVESISPYGNAYLGTIDLKVCPTVSVYLPGRKGPMVTLNTCDSIYWEEVGNSVAYTGSRLISEKEMVRQGSEFAGTVPVRRLLPYWKTADRYLFTNGSVNMRDAAIYVKEKNWEEAIKLWKQVYQHKKGKQKMYAAYNLALGYELQDSIGPALEWARKAQAEALKVDKVEEKKSAEGVYAEDVPNYLLTSLYVTELEKRQESITRLKMQMQRFEP